MHFCIAHIAQLGCELCRALSLCSQTRWLVAARQTLLTSFALDKQADELLPCMQLKQVGKQLPDPRAESHQVGKQSSHCH